MVLYSTAKRFAIPVKEKVLCSLTRKLVKYMIQKHIQLTLTDDEIELFRQRPSAFLLLCVVAKRAKRNMSHPDKELQIGEAYLGDWEMYSSGRQIYRTDLKFLEKHQKLTTRITNRGTIARLVTASPFNINQQELTTDLTINQPPTNHQLTTKSSGKEVPIKTFIEEFNKRFQTEYQVTDNRTRQLQLRLKKYTMEQVLRSLHNMAMDPFNQGQNERAWVANPEYILRSDEQIDRFLNVKKKVSAVKYLN